MRRMGAFPGLVLLIIAAFFIGFGLSRGSSALPVNLYIPSATTTAITAEESADSTTDSCANLSSATHPTEPTVPETTPPIIPAATVPPRPPETIAPPDTERDPYDIRQYSPSTFALTVLEEINRLRQERGLPAFTPDPQLCAVASVRASELSRSYSKLRPDGTDSHSLLHEYHYSFTAADACLSMQSGDASPARIVSGWMTQASHLLLSDRFTHFGAEIYRSGDELFIALYLCVPG